MERIVCARLGPELVTFWWGEEGCAGWEGVF